MPAKKSESLKAMARRIAVEHGADPETISRLIGAESSWKPEARSPVGAAGLTQLMPVIAKAYGVKKIFNPAENIRAGVKYFQSLQDRYGAPELAAAAYNAGPEAVDRYGGIPPYRETQSFVDKVVPMSGQAAPKHGGKRLVTQPESATYAPSPHHAVPSIFSSPAKDVGQYQDSPYSHPTVPGVEHYDTSLYQRFPEYFPQSTVGKYEPYPRLPSRQIESHSVDLARMN